MDGHDQGLAEGIVAIDGRRARAGAGVLGPATDRQGGQGVDQGRCPPDPGGVGRQRLKPVVMAGMRCMLKTLWSRHMLE